MSFLFGPKVEEADVRATSAELADAGGDAILVDVREPHEWRAGHVAEARHIPLQQLPEQLASLPRETPVYLICRSGNRSGHAAAYLKQAGFERPINVKGGMIAWERAGLPIER
ncbi:MAG TPA: rhodanese-like domain-containing protein [Candidatus Angelobacter sp.]|nr:rhodanese-like domain-containing protein [Candidatus Angelobacter sp.]